MAQFFLVDTFSPVHLNGSAAGVVLIDKSIPADKNLKQALASEINQAATAFPSPVDTDDFQTAKKFNLQWFTPTTELSACGNGTLAAAHVLSNNIRNPNEEFEFSTHFGAIKAHVAKHELVKIAMPSVKIYSLNSNKQALTDKLEQLEDPSGVGSKVAQALIPSNVNVSQLVYSPQLKYLLIALDQQTTHEQFVSINPSKDKLLAIDPNGDVMKAVIVTFHFIPNEQTAVKSFLALTTQPDYVLRVFEPWSGVDEDIATGSAQCVAAPFWSAVYNRTENLRAHQYSPRRSAEFRIDSVSQHAVEMSGHALTTLSGIISDRCFK
ncbi:Phenazine biosynthesis protein, PhzF family [Aphelenchoides bicaudatus]|nr:Phenazine biosynthesis protein, PhzF family [Aphelenchoides bicaudatus]